MSHRIWARKMSSECHNIYVSYLNYLTMTYHYSFLLVYHDKRKEWIKFNSVMSNFVHGVQYRIVSRDSFDLFCFIEEITFLMVLLYFWKNILVPDIFNWLILFFDDFLHVHMCSDHSLPNYLLCLSHSHNLPSKPYQSISQVMLYFLFCFLTQFNPGNWCDCWNGIFLCSQVGSPMGTQPKEKPLHPHPHRDKAKR